MPVRLLGLYGAHAHTHLGRKALYNTSNLARIYGRRINPELNMASSASLRNFQAKYIGLQMPLDKALLVSRNPRTIPPIYTGSFSFSAHSKPLHTYIHTYMCSATSYGSSSMVSLLFDETQTFLGLVYVISHVSLPGECIFARKLSLLSEHWFASIHLYVLIHGASVSGQNV